MSRAAIYTRISDDRTGEAAGVARQETDCKEFANRHGFDVVGIFRDNDISASRYARKRRPAYRAMIEAVERGDVDVVVAWHVDRLYRQPRELEDLIDLAEKRGVAIHTLYGKLDLTGSDGRAMARVLVAMAAKQSDDSSRRIRRKQQEMREQGRYHGGSRMFGFEASAAGGRLPVVREEEAALIREAATRVLAGEGLLTIARDWNARGLAAPLGGAFRPKTIRDALLRDLTAPAILTADRQQQVRAVLDDPDRRKQATTARSHLLSGLMTCGLCGSPLRSKPRNDGKAGYACDAEGCKRVSGLAEPLDEYVRNYLLVGLTGPELAATLAENRSDDPATTELTAELEGFEARLVALETDYMDGGIDLPTWKRMRAGLELRIADARKALARQTKHRVLAELPGDLGALQAWWAAASLDQRRAVITGALESITLAPARRGIKVFDPDRVTFVWRVS